MDHLKEGINLRSYGQKDPLVEYKREAYTLYENMKFAIKKAVIERVSHIKLLTKEEIEEIHRQNEVMLEAQLKAHQETEAAKTHEEEKKVIRASLKVGRNDPCPCGSGKKFKACHGA
jgi:preprotein translocase subunit SecA